MRFVIGLALLACLANSAFSAVVELAPLTTTLKGDAKTASALLLNGEQLIKSITGFQSNQTINVQGEIADIPQIMNQTMTDLLSLKSMVLSLFKMFTDDLTVSSSQASGAIVDIPNAMLSPYTNAFAGFENDFDVLLNDFDQGRQLIVNCIEPLLNEESVSSKGGFDVPTACVTKLLDLLESGMATATTLLNNVGQAANASAAAAPKNLSMKPSIAMGKVNEMVSEAVVSIKPMLTIAEATIKSVSITNLGNGYDQINIQQILMMLNKTLEGLYSMLSGLNTEIPKLLGLLNLVNNPIGGFFFNLF